MHVSREWWSTILSSLLILLFIYTASEKLLVRQQFEAVLSNMPYIRSAAPVISWAVPLAEILIAALLLLPKRRRTGLLLSCILLVLFTTYLGLVFCWRPICLVPAVVLSVNWDGRNTSFSISQLQGWHI